VEETTRLAAHIVAATLLQQQLKVVLVTTGGTGTVETLTRPGDLVSIWTQRSVQPLQLKASLAAARAMGRTLPAEGPPAAGGVLPVTHAWLGADEQELPAREELRALFVQYPGQQVTPPFAAACQRWECVKPGQREGLDAVMGRLLA